MPTMCGNRNTMREVKEVYPVCKILQMVTNDVLGSVCKFEFTYKLLIPRLSRIFILYSWIIAS